MNSRTARTIADGRVPPKVTGGLRSVRGGGCDADYTPFGGCLRWVNSVISGICSVGPVNLQLLNMTHRTWPAAVPSTHPFLGARLGQPPTHRRLSDRVLATFELGPIRRCRRRSSTSRCL